MMSPAQLERQQARRDRLTQQDTGNVQLPTVPDDAQQTAGALVDWVGDDPNRAKAAAAVNDARDKPWATVTKHIDGLA